MSPQSNRIPEINRILGRNIEVLMARDMVRSNSLAAVLEMSVDRLGDLKRGRIRYINLEYLPLLAEVFDTTIDNLLKKMPEVRYEDSE
jgi:DNA-binding Xre family transcriptional regulator